MGPPPLWLGVASRAGIVLLCCVCCIAFLLTRPATTAEDGKATDTAERVIAENKTSQETEQAAKEKARREAEAEKEKAEKAEREVKAEQEATEKADARPGKKPNVRPGEKLIPVSPTALSVNGASQTAAMERGRDRSDPPERERHESTW